MYTHHRSHMRGFTLIEVMIVTVLVAILVALAAPSYLEHIRRGQRAAARTALLEAAQYMQKIYAANDRYDQLVGVAPPNNVVTLPEALRSIPAGAAPAYTLTITAVDRTTYALKATPAGSMASDPCGALTLDHTDLRGAAGPRSAAFCWR